MGNISGYQRGHIVDQERDRAGLKGWSWGPSGDVDQAEIEAGSDKAREDMIVISGDRNRQRQRRQRWLQTGTGTGLDKSSQHRRIWGQMKNRTGI